jgi:hypothetical protein
MWQRWSRLLEALGRLRFPVITQTGDVSVGDPTAPDAEGGRGWQAYARAEALFQAWGPLEGSPWEPYHAVPLFAAVDRVKQRSLGPTPLREVQEATAGTGGRALGRNEGFRLPDHARPGAPAPPWALDPATMVVVDLPGRSTVEAAAWLVTEAGLQPVCTFDHWPHRQGLIRAERVLAELLRWVTTVVSARGRIATDAPPLWICDSTRLGTRKGRPGEFDNRYYLDDSILPSAKLLLANGLAHVVYLGWKGDEAGPDVPGPTGEVPVADLVEWFTELLTAGIEVLHVPVNDPGLGPRPFQAPTKRPRFSVRGYRRSAAGGFGTEVPEPSSSGSSG